MSFMDDIGKKLNFAVTEAASKTKELSSVFKLNSSIAAREREIEAAFTAMGRLLFEREAADPESPAAALCAKVTANQESIAEMKQKIASIKEEAKASRKAHAQAVFGADSPARSKQKSTPGFAEKAADEFGATNQESIAETKNKVASAKDANKSEAYAEAVIFGADGPAQSVSGCVEKTADDVCETVAEKLGAVADNLEEAAQATRPDAQPEEPTV